MIFPLLALGALFFFTNRDDDKPNTANGIGSTSNRTKWLKVYESTPTGKSYGKTNMSIANGKIGLYFIKEDGVIVYVGQSKYNLYKTALRHFQKWNDTEQKARISYKKYLDFADYEIQFLFLSKSWIDDEECKYIKKHDPRDNKNKCSWMFDEDYEEAPF
jgi:hypothetical protein